MKKESLTKEEEALAIVVRDEWINKLGSLQLDKEKAKKGIEFLYSEAGLKAPERIVYVCSPLGMQFAYKRIKEAKSEDIFKDLEQKVFEDVKSGKLEFGSDFSFQPMGSRGSVTDWHWVAFYDFFQRIGVELTPKFEFFKENCCNSGVLDYLLYEKVAIACAHPKSIHWIKLNDERVLHGDGKSAIEWEDGFCVHVLNGTPVPEYLAMTPSGVLNLDFFLKEQNADVKIEFLSKYGIDRLISHENAVLIDSFESYNENSTKFRFYRESRYELIDLAKVLNLPNTDYAPHLKMVHATTGAIVVEGVSPSCKTIPDALDDRNEEDMSQFETIAMK